LEKHSSEMQTLNDTLRQRDAEISAMKSEDARRIAALQSAVQSYVTRSPYNA